MNIRMAALTGAALSMGLLSACAKPAETTAEASADATTATANAADSTVAATANAADGATSPGGALSPPPANGNEAVNTDGAMTDASQSAGSNSFTEDQARGHIEKAGYGDVTGLTKTPDGMWTGKAKKNGKTMDVSVDFKGAVSAK